MLSTSGSPHRLVCITFRPTPVFSGTRWRTSFLGVLPVWAFCEVSCWPIRAVRQQLRRELLELWTTRWQAEFRHTELYRWVQGLRSLPSFFPPPQTLVTPLTGHGRFPHYFYRFHLLDSPRCPCGSYCRDMSHVLHTCPITAPYTSLIQPQAVYRAARYPAILESPRNRALFVARFLR
ncbi:hypothetical protein MTO96_041944 [Rhipicephalus appendiculatus]